MDLRMYPVFRTSINLAMVSSLAFSCAVTATLAADNEKTAAQSGIEVVDRNSDSKPSVD